LLIARTERAERRRETDVSERRTEGRREKGGEERAQGLGRVTSVGGGELG